MDYVKVAESYLWEYQLLNKSINAMQRELEKLLERSGPQGDKNMAVSLNRVGGGKSSSQMDDTVNQIYRVQELRESIDDTLDRVSDIDAALGDISAGEGCERYGELLWIWYVERLPKDEIAEQMGFQTRKSVYDLRDKAIRRFAVRVLGIKALDAI